MLTTMFTSAIGRKIAHASQAPSSVRTISSIPRPPERMPTRDAESSVKITIGTTPSATQRRSKPNHAPARSLRGDGASADHSGRGQCRRTDKPREEPDEREPGDSRASGHRR